MTNRPQKPMTDEAYSWMRSVFFFVVLIILIRRSVSSADVFELLFGMIMYVTPTAFSFYELDSQKSDSLPDEHATSLRRKATFNIWYSLILIGLITVLFFMKDDIDTVNPMLVSLLWVLTIPPTCWAYWNNMWRLSFLDDLNRERKRANELVDESTHKMLGVVMHDVEVQKLEKGDIRKQAQRDYVKKHNRQPKTKAKSKK